MLVNIYIIMYDAYNFFKKNKINIFVLSIFSALINILLQYLLNLNENEVSILYKINFFKNIPVTRIIQDIDIHQKKIIFYMKYIKIFYLLVSQSVLCTSLIYLIKSITHSKCYNNYNYVIKKTFKSFFLLIPIIGLQYLLMEISFSYRSMPRIFFSLCLMMSSIIFLIEKKNIFSALKNSINIIWKNIFITLPIIIFWFILKLIIITLFKFFFIFSLYKNIFILHVILNIGFSYIIIYLFRLYIFQK